ncbi:MAG: citrate (Si)-synthase [Methylobacter sp.]|nr:MAG: citrate (Si)-synthase [Methylobacter sp.]PPD24238.1 MAG: citrate (Si)-synthase [Methylobacter sp.]PPD37605.1 MAG: citrate (Si)-synthase [Methylomonas sp.]
MSKKLKTIAPAMLTLEDKTYSLPVFEGAENEKAIDISCLRNKTGYITLDDGYGNTGSCESAITYIDGENGILRYRGYPIEELAEQSRFVEVAYLLLYGNLPNHEQLENFSKGLNESSIIHEDMHHFFNGFPRGSHPMGILATMIASLSTFYPVPDIMDPVSEMQIVTNLVSQVRTIAAFSYKKSIGEPLVYPSIKYKYVANFLYMMFSSPVKDYQLDEDIVKAIDMLLILHADHEQNCSTSSVRMAGSSLANIYAVISAGIAALWGQRHGGANQEVIKMLQQIHAEGGDGGEFINQAKDKSSTKRLMGFGHRVYKNYDPRATVLKKYCDIILNKPGFNDPLFDIAKRLEEVALSDDYFISRKLYPNVDFYSGLILRAAGIPTNMFTVLFAIGRMPGWLSHWREMIHSDQITIHRPRQIYVGEPLRHYQPIEMRD